MALFTRRWYIDKLNIFYANQTSIDPHQKKGWGCNRQSSLSPSVFFFTDRSKAVLLSWILFVICASCLSCCIVSSLQPCSLGSLVCDVFVWFCHFPMWCHGSVVVLDCINFWSVPTCLLICYIVSLLFGQKLKSSVISFLAGGDFCRLLISFENRLDPD